MSQNDDHRRSDNQQEQRLGEYEAAQVATKPLTKTEQYQSPWSVHSCLS